MGTDLEWRSESLSSPCAKQVVVRVVRFMRGLSPWACRLLRYMYGFIYSVCSHSVSPRGSILIILHILGSPRGSILIILYILGVKHMLNVGTRARARERDERESSRLDE